MHQVNSGRSGLERAKKQEENKEHGSLKCCASYFIYSYPSQFESVFPFSLLIVG